MTDPFKKYQNPPPKIDTRTIVDNPLIDNPAISDTNNLLPKQGISLGYDNFYDSTDRIQNATNTTDVRFNKDDLWNADPGEIYGAGLSGIDVTPESKHPFDLGKFNIVFEREKEKAKESQRINDLNKLNNLSSEQQKVSLYNLSLFQIIVNIKNSWFNLLDDLLDQRFELETFTKDNRMFYIGLTIVFIAVILYLYIMMLYDTDENIKETKTSSSDVKHIYHIYQYPTSESKQIETISDSKQFSTSTSTV